MGDPAKAMATQLANIETRTGKTLKELAAIITFERNAWGNATGDVVQAADVAAARGK